MNWISCLVHDSKTPLLFHSGLFLVLFALFLLIYAAVFPRKSLRDWLIILFSGYFYYKSSGSFLALLVASVLVNYGFARGLHASGSVIVRRLLLFLGIVVSLAPLVYFKYFEFLCENLGLTGAAQLAAGLVLPIGISFYTFQSISYLVDMHKGLIAPGGLRGYLLYMTFFPHLVAGPIVRGRDFLPQIEEPTVLDRRRIREAMWLIVKGLVKKAIVADFVAQYSDVVFSAPEGFRGAEHFLAALCYALQIFCDFSGYTDMAIGVALLLGFRLCRNFDSPYKSVSITQFWRRWHISLSSWLRDYVYIPLGGNRRGVPLQLAFLLVTMLVGGIWHGASWKFVFWGAAHGLLLVLHKLYRMILPAGIRLPGWPIAARLLTFACVALLWIPFRADTMSDAWTFYVRIFTDFDPAYLPVLLAANPLLIWFVLGGYAATAMPDRCKETVRRAFDRTDLWLKFVLLAVLIQLVLQMKSASVHPFIYFQF